MDTNKPAVKGSSKVTVSDKAVVAASGAVLGLRELIPSLPEGFREPTFLGPMVSAVRGIASLPTKTLADRGKVRDAYVAAMAKSLPGTPEPKGKHTGRFTGMAVFETQNAIYLACALANVVVDEGHIVAMWRGELPHAKCDYLGRAYDRAYPWSTLGEYVRGSHNGIPSIPGAVEAVIAWRERGRKPIVK